MCPLKQITLFLYGLNIYEYYPCWKELKNVHVGAKRNMNCFLCDRHAVACPCFLMQPMKKEDKKNISSGEDAFLSEEELQEEYETQREKVLA